MKEVRIETKLQNKGHYVPGMISGNTLYISGQLPVHHETGAPMADGIAQQTKDALHNGALIEIEAVAELPIEKQEGIL